MTFICSNDVRPHQMHQTLRLFTERRDLFWGSQNDCKSLFVLTLDWANPRLRTA